MAKDFNDANWDQMLSGRLPRTEIPYDKKRDDYKNYLDITFGLQGGQLRVPRSAINSQEIEMFIRKLTRDRQLDSFDRYLFPFVRLPPILPMARLWFLTRAAGGSLAGQHGRSRTV
jgi:NTE family protein